MKIPSIIEAEMDAKEMIKGINNGWNGNFSEYTRFYHVATEDIQTYIKHMNSSFKTTLTIGASGDQGVAASVKGAKDVYLFDINRADIYFLVLKKVALENLRRKDFLDFLVAENNGIILEYRLYEKIKDKLPLPINIFWSILYKYFNYNNAFMSEELFRSPWKHAKMAKIVNGYYINNQTYYEAQQKVQESTWHFIPGDFYDLHKNLPTNINFDAMILSNLYEYLNFGHDMNASNAKKYVRYIKDELMPRLNTNGELMAAYLCRYDDEVDKFISQSLIDNPDGWAPSDDVLRGLQNFESYFTGYTGQNISYHYLLNELDGMSYQKVKTKWSGYGMSSAKTDLAIIIKK